MCKESDFQFESNQQFENGSLANGELARRGGGVHYRVKTNPTVYQSNLLAIGSQIPPAISFPGWLAGWSESNFIP